MEGTAGTPAAEIVLRGTARTEGIITETVRAITAETVPRGTVRTEGITMEARATTVENDSRTTVPITAEGRAEEIIWAVR